jgi:hypothetical protein
MNSIFHQYLQAAIPPELYLYTVISPEFYLLQMTLGLHMILKITSSSIPPDVLHKVNLKVNHISKV